MVQPQTQAVPMASAFAAYGVEGGGVDIRFTGHQQQQQYYQAAAAMMPSYAQQQVEYQQQQQPMSSQSISPSPSPSPHQRTTDRGYTNIKKIWGEQ
mmetsp:Transcript_30515/g.75748  ORF Transcript_30515/g.75748 Transcript_30515/m.75748 type:complete len:96 (-) Transcript_30515:355-642(-)